MYMHLKAKLRQIWVRTWVLEISDTSGYLSSLLSALCYLRNAINKYIYCQIFLICFKLFKKTNNYKIIRPTSTAYTILYYIIRVRHLISLAFSTIDDVIVKDSVIHFPFNFFYILKVPPKKTNNYKIIRPTSTAYTILYYIIRVRHLISLAFSTIDD